MAFFIWSFERLLFEAFCYLLFGKPWDLSTLLSWWRAKRPQQPQNPNSTLLKMPVEIITMISSKLPLQNQIIFSMTCRPIRTTLGHLQGAVTQLTRDQQLEFLTIIARDLLDKWVCVNCVKLHGVDLRDTPRSPFSFPLITKCSQRRRTDGMFERDSSLIEGITLHYRHVQLALKYTRMGSELRPLYRRYLNNLMKPCYGRFDHHPHRPGAIKAWYMVAPKIVNGRYLLKCSYSYKKHHAELSLLNLGLLIICQHQGFWSLIEPLRNNNFFRQQGCMLERVIREAFTHPGTTMRGSCESCPVDFSLEATPEQATLRAWYDVGSERYLINPTWRVHQFQRQLDGYVPHDPDLPEMLTLYHQPGSVARLYDGDSVDL